MSTFFHNTITSHMTTLDAPDVGRSYVALRDDKDGATDAETGARAKYLVRWDTAGDEWCVAARPGARARRLLRLGRLYPRGTRAAPEQLPISTQSAPNQLPIITQSSPNQRPISSYSSLDRGE